MALRDIMIAIYFHLLRNLLRKSKAQHHAVSKLLENVESNGHSIGELKVEDWQVYLEKMDFLKH